MMGSNVVAQPLIETAEDDPRYGILSPIPDHGGVRPIVDLLTSPTQGQIANRALSRQFTRQIRAIRHE